MVVTTAALFPILEGEASPIWVALVEAQHDADDECDDPD